MGPLGRKAWVRQWQILGAGPDMEVVGCLLDPVQVCTVAGHENESLQVEPAWCLMMLGTIGVVCMQGGSEPIESGT